MQYICIRTQANVSIFQDSSNQLHILFVTSNARDYRRDSSRTSQFHHMLFSCDAYIDLRSSHIFVSHGTQQLFLPTVVDSGASIILSPLHSDLVTFRQYSSSLNDVEAKGVGKVRRDIIDQQGVKSTIETLQYFFPEAEICLYYRRNNFKEHKSGCLLLIFDECTLKDPNTDIICHFFVATQ